MTIEEIKKIISNISNNEEFYEFFLKQLKTHRIKDEETCVLIRTTLDDIKEVAYTARAGNMCTIEFYPTMESATKVVINSISTARYGSINCGIMEINGDRTIYTYEHMSHHNDGFNIPNATLKSYMEKEFDGDEERRITKVSTVTRMGDTKINISEYINLKYKNAIVFRNDKEVINGTKRDRTVKHYIYEGISLTEYDQKDVRDKNWIELSREDEFNDLLFEDSFERNNNISLSKINKTNND